MLTNQLTEFISTMRGIKNTTFIYIYTHKYIISCCFQREGEEPGCTGEREMLKGATHSP